MRIGSDDIVETIQATRRWVNDPLEFERFSVYMQESFEVNVQMRLCKWLRFFSDNYSRCVCLYSASVFALIDVFESSTLYWVQTAHEREASFSFYTKLFDTKVFLEATDKEDAKHLLTIALIYGRYPGMQIRPIRQATGILVKHGLNEQSLHKVFACLFVKYENPRAITYNLANLQLQEVDALMFALQGNNIGSHPGLPVPISKKTSFVLMNEVPEMSFKNNVFKRGVAVAQLVRVSQSPELLGEFLHGCSTFNTNIDAFLQDVNFWQHAYRMLVEVTKHGHDLNVSVQEFIDYFEYQKYHAGREGYSLKGRTALSVARAIHEWHGNLGQYARQQDLNRVWKRLAHTEKKYEIRDGSDRYVFKEITTGADLANESRMMEHCVFSYLPDCLSGYCSIWSMKKASGDRWNTNRKAAYYFGCHMTIEVVDGVIVQVAGKRNEYPIRKDWQVIKKWAQAVGFSIGEDC